MRIVVMNHVSLDGVMQGPGRPGEDDRGGFTHSGWAAARADDPVVATFVGERMADGRGWLMGRRTYEDLMQRWTSDPDRPFGAMLTKATKYVATTRPDEPLAWPNSTPLVGESVDSPDVIEQIGILRSSGDGVLGVMGSSVLIHAMQRDGLIDEYALMIHPLVLGTGIRLFAEDVVCRQLQPVEPARTSDSGVVVAAFRPA
jgi:dihydrofolate reductase